MNEKEAKKKFEEIRDRVHRTSLYISTNLREEDKTRFRKIAYSQFNGDYGLTLRWLLDCSEGYFMKPDEVLTEKIDLLAEEIKQIKEELAKMKTEAAKPQPKTTKTFSGRIIGGMKNE
jgi:hypothetical protein